MFVFSLQKASFIIISTAFMGIPVINEWITATEVVINELITNTFGCY